MFVLWTQGLNKGAKGKSDEESEDDKESESVEESEEEEEEDFIPLGNKRSQQSNGESFSKKQKFDSMPGKIINTATLRCSISYL